MKTLIIGDITVCMAPIAPPGAPQKRRAVERAAVEVIIREHLGPGYSLAHHDSGAPYLVADVSDLPVPFISITHSRNLAAVAFCYTAEVGIDAEEWRDALMRVRHRFLSAEELELFVSPEQLLQVWTIKEAVYKIAGSPALDFAAAINISPDMSVARAAGRIYCLTTLTEGRALVTVAQ